MARRTTAILVYRPVGQLRPIEIQQAIGSLAAARTQYLDAVMDYNSAQMQMLRAIGQPPEAPVDNGP